jgi:hypothetical protein
MSALFGNEGEDKSREAARRNRIDDLERSERGIELVSM